MEKKKQNKMNGNKNKGDEKKKVWKEETQWDEINEQKN